MLGIWQLNQIMLKMSGLLGWGFDNIFGLCGFAGIT